MPRTTAATVAPDTQTPVPPARAIRSDAKRNRDKLLAAATAAFAEQDPTEASLEAVARRAGVGIGTLYRHFPNRAALIEAVYRNEVETLCEGTDELLAQYPADEALARWMERFIGYVAVKRGLVAAMKQLLDADSDVFAYCHELLRAGMGKLVAAAVEADVICERADPDDLLRAIGGFCMAGDQTGWQERAVRLVSLLMDGLRYRAPAGRPGE